MAKKIDDFKTSKKAIISDVCTVKVPNFFTLPEYESSFEINSPLFKFAKGTWCFQFIFEDWAKNCSREFAVYMKRISSEIPHHSVIYKITLLDSNDKKYADFDGSNVFKEDGEKCVMEYFCNESPSYDRRDVLTLIIHLICHELTERDAKKAPQLQDFHAKMAEEKKDCKVSLKLSKKSISSDVCTLKLSNFFTVQEHDGTAVEINSPSFEFANGAWCFQFHSHNPQEEFTVYILRLNSETNNVKKDLIEKIFYFITLQDNNEKKYDNFGCVCDFEEDEKKDKLYNFTKKSPSDTLDTPTLIIHLFPTTLLDVDVDTMPLTDMDLLSRDFKNLYLNEINTDLTLRVADKEFRVHQAILKTRSEVFESMLSHDILLRKKGVIYEPDCDPQAMEQLLLYMYSGKVEMLNQDNVLGLYYAADKYKMMFLKDQCAKFIKNSLSPSIICDVIQLAWNQNDNDLLEYATEYFVDHISDILLTQGWISFKKLNSIAANELLIKAAEK